MNKGPREKQRLDLILVERGLAESREQARRLVLAGKVTVSGADNPKPGQQYFNDVVIEVTAPEKFVSRGGLKLEAALDYFKVNPAGRVCADIGASTGGFTDCLVQHDAELVFAVDVGASQMHERIKTNARVVLVEHTNARELTSARFSQLPSLVAVDVSFISITKILPSLRSSVAPGAECIALIKPQFESERAEVSRGKGVIKDPAVHRRILASLIDQFPALGWMPRGLMPSPITGGSGNAEFLVYLATREESEQDQREVHIDIDGVLQEVRKSV